MKNHFLFISFFLVLCSRGIVPQYNTPVLEGTHNNAYTTVEPPSIYKYRTVLGKTATSDFQVTYSDTVAPPLQARTAIEYAINIWEFLINSSQPIKVYVLWEDLGYSSTAGYPLANCRSATYYNSTSLPESNVQYPIALAEHLLNQNLNGTDYDMIITVNSHDSVSWYFGTDGVPQQDKPDMVSVILHETAHGLGYIGFFNVSGDYGYKGKSGFPVDTNSHSSIYDTYTSLGSYYPALDFLVNYPNHSTELKTKLTSNNVYFSGDNAWIQNGRNILPKLYAPAGWKAGSSILHLDDATFPQGNSNSLMTHQLDQAEVIHSPGEVGLAVLQDLGWSINRLATFIHPEPGIALQKNAVDTIKWTDNLGGSYNLVLLDSIDNFIMTVCTLGTADEGLNEYVWTVPANVPNGKYRIKIQFGGAFGITNLFTISDQQQVASPVFTPPPDTYENPITVTASCPTSGATIRYTTNGMEPNGNSPVFPASLEITTLTTIKAKAFKSGMLPSLTTTAVYNIGIEITVPEITPLSGTYPQGLRTTISWQQGLRCFMNWTDDGSEPYDPSIPGHQWELTWNPTYNLWPDIRTIKMKARTYLNGSWSSLVEREYIIIPGVNIKQLDASGTPFGQAAYWNTSQWKYVEPDSAVAMANNKNHFLSTQEFKPNTFQKFNFWDDNLDNERYRNWDTLTIDSDTREVRSHFDYTFNEIIIKNNLELTGIDGGQVEFMDPWLVDFNEPPYGNRSRGMDAPFFPKTSPFNPNYSSSHKGVFLNQDPSQTPTYYKVGMPTEQTISINGQNRKFFPYKWRNDGGVTFQNEYARQTGAVFTSSNATATAILKGQLMSNDQNGISSDSQRKLVRTDNGIYHIVYESMGEVWYTHSYTADFHGSWTQEVSLSAEYEYQSAKNPSIDFYGNNLAVVFEGINPSDEKKIICLLYNGSSWSQPYEIADIQESYYGNAKPVVAYTPYEVFVCYKNYSTAGFKYKRYYNPNWSNEFTITDTDVNSINPSIACKKALGAPQSVHIAYQSGETQIKYVYCYQNGTGGGTWSVVPDAKPVSDGAGYTNNRYPSISLRKNGNYYDPIVSWTGTRKEIVDEDMPGKGNDLMMYVYRLITRPKTTGWKDFYVTGSYVNYSNNNSATGTNQETVITFSANGGAVSKWLKRTSLGYSNVSDLSHSGKQIQVSGGNNLNLVKALAFNTSSPPYPLNKITTVFDYASKITADSLPTFGRTGVVYKDGVEFVFFLGDMLLNSENVMFIERADTLPVADITELNGAMKTNTFYLDSNSDLYFSVFYYVINTELADSALIENDIVTFRVELVNAENNQVIGTFDEVIYDLNNLSEYDNIDYKVDCTGIATGNYFFRLVTSVQGDAGLFLSNVQNDNEMLLKKSYQTVKFNKELIPIEYTLEQNYPNPFNPTTTIRYQIPKEGMVTLKVYDILGAEVATLVNEEKIAGKYEVNFDASRLASGVYIYRLNVNDFVNVKKMVLLK